MNRRVGLLAAVIAMALFAPGLAPAAPVGKLDSAFGRRGYVVTSFPSLPNGTASSSVANGVLTQRNGDVIAFGEGGWPFLTQDFNVVRYRANGALDSSFGRRGRAVVRATDSGLWKGAIRGGLTGNGSIVLSGVLGYGPAAGIAGPSEFVVSRLRPNGILDNAFGTRGIARVPLPPDIFGIDPTSIGMEVSPNGTVTIAAWHDTPSTVVLARLTPRGALDESFGSRGIVVVPTPESYAAAGIASLGRRLVIASSGMAGTTLRALSSDGSPDTTFGSHGVVLISGSGMEATAVARGPGGTLLVGGSQADPLGDSKSLLVRIRADGTPDPAFGRSGIANLRGLGVQNFVATPTRTYAFVWERFPTSFTSGWVSLSAFDAAGRREHWRAAPVPGNPRIGGLSFAGGRLYMPGGIDRGTAVDFAVYRFLP